MMKPIVEEAILELCSTTTPSALTVADLGCSVGPNSLQAVSMVLEIVYQYCRNSGCCLPELQFFLNDLPINNFNTICESVPSLHRKLTEEKGDKYRPCFISVTPGSFYDRLFPTRILHFVYSANSLHWLSQVPQLLRNAGMANSNKGKIALGRSSPHCVYEAYLEQFQKDFSTFLTSRSQEIMLGGRMVLSLFGRKSPHHTSKECCYFYENLEQALRAMVSEGAIDEAKLASFNLPYYEPHIEELRHVIQKQGSFNIVRLEEFRLDPVAFKATGFSINPKSITNSQRAVMEPMITSYFGHAIVDNLFHKLEEIMLEKDWSTGPMTTTLFVYLSRKI